MYCYNLFPFFRIPAEIAEAHCLCENCIGSNGQTECEPIYVMKKVKWIHHDKNREGWDRIAKGCTCANPRRVKAK